MNINGNVCSRYNIQLKYMVSCKAKSLVLSTYLHIQTNEYWQTQQGVLIYHWRQYYCCKNDSNMVRAFYKQEGPEGPGSLT